MKQILISIAVMAITTYLIRMLPFVLFRKKITNNYIDRKIKKKDVKPVLSYDDKIQEG